MSDHACVSCVLEYLGARMYPENSLCLEAMFTRKGARNDAQSDLLMAHCKVVKAEAAWVGGSTAFRVLTFSKKAARWEYS